MTALASLDSGPTEPARHSDLERLRALLNAAEPDVHPDTARDLDETWPYYQVIRNSRDDVVAAGALIPLDDQRAEIRGLVVAAHSRGQGLAKSVVRALIDTAEASDLLAVCVTRRPEFFEQFDFQPTNQSWTLPLRRRRFPIAVVGRPRIAMTLSDNRR